MKKKNSTSLKKKEKNDIPVWVFRHPQHFVKPAYVMVWVSWVWVWVGLHQPVADPCAVGYANRHMHIQDATSIDGCCQGMTVDERTSLRWPPASQRCKYRERKGIAALAANKTQKVAKVQSVGKCESHETTGEAAGAKRGKVESHRSHEHRCSHSLQSMGKSQVAKSCSKGMSTQAPQQRGRERNSKRL